MGSNINCYLKNKTNDFKWFPWVIYQLTDDSNTAQSLFIRGVNDEFEVTEKLASLKSLCGMITGENIYKEINTKSVQADVEFAEMRYN